MTRPIKRRLILAAIVIAALAPAAALGQAGKQIKVGVSAGPYGDILREAAKLAEKEGLKVEVVEFTDWNQPNAALAAGDLDLNNFQHRPYLANQIKARGYKIVALDPSIVVPAGIYSSKFATAADIPEARRSRSPTIRPTPRVRFSCSNRPGC